MTLKDFLNENDRFAKSSGAVITELREGYARGELKVEDCHLNGGGVCQGGAIFTLADLVFAAAVNSHKTLTFSIQSSISFFKSAMKGDVLSAEAIETFNHKRVPYCEVKVTNQNGELISAFTGVCYRKTGVEMPVDGLS